MSRFFAVFVLIAATLQNSAIGAQSAPTLKSETASGADASKGQNRDYVLQPQDMIRVMVYGEEEINRGGEVRLSQNAMVTLPLIQQVELKGLTIAQAEAHITRLYAADYLVKPYVTVTVVEYYKREVQVVGQVGSPGIIGFPREDGMTLMGAISRAGSFNRLANPRKVTIMRTSADGKSEVQTFDLNDFVEKGKGTDVWLQPGDIINVPERVI